MNLSLTSSARKSLSYTLTLLMLIVLTGCPLFEDEEEAKGACETSLINIEGYRLYKCENDEDQQSCSTNESDFTDVFWEGRTCINLGYFYDGGSSGWRYDEQNNVKPGAYGNWGDGTASGTEADANNSGGASCSEDDYDGPEFDIQIDSQCKLAFIYRCSQADEAADVACSIYQGWRDQNPSIPACPYCN